MLRTISECGPFPLLRPRPARPFPRSKGQGLGGVSGLNLLIGPRFRPQSTAGLAHLDTEYCQTAHSSGAMRRRTASPRYLRCELLGECCITA